jgi:pilus assembly protein Flp/PilA
MRIVFAAKSLWSDQRGVTALEYGLIASLVAVGLVAALGTFKGTLVTAFTAMGTSL